ncbi:MAG: LEA14-like dessication related protein [Myxococcota bacterium]|jgi:LEA14-like dessication related protein
MTLLSHNVRILPAVLAVLSLASCSQLGALGDVLKPYTPKVSFSNLQLNSIDFSQVAVDFVFTVDNPNPISVKLDTFSYALGFAGVEFAKGVNEDGIALKSRGTTQFSIPLSVKFTDLFDLVSNVGNKDAVAYSISGDFGFKTPVGVARVPFKHQGDFPVVRAPDVSLKGLRMGKLDVFGGKASINLDIGLKNAHGGSAITFSGLDYAVELSNTKVAAGLVNNIPAVATGAEQTVTIPVNLNLISLGGAIVSAITNKTSVDVGFGATVNVGTPFGIIPLSIDQNGNLKIN